jgi:hypothetical protein
MVPRLLFLSFFRFSSTLASRQLTMGIKCVLLVTIQSLVKSHLFNQNKINELRKFPRKVREELAIAGIPNNWSCRQSVYVCYLLN